ncbi:glioma pathogenesis-related protein 1 [Aplysia californica]|uniref:Glioma pathogenesis-related protein 1 n=1 Tax=Aplysia californica TaxID=6500 RepID=A0ABM0JJF3_APLCA|nr:glioma pathogenesis-related protein 1 [Aplysia californica]
MFNTRDLPSLSMSCFALSWCALTCLLFLRIDAAATEDSSAHAAQVRETMTQIARKRREITDVVPKSDLSKEGFTQEEKDSIIHVHNSFRSVVNDPPASNMREVIWDDAIANFAQEWANGCGGRHRDSRNLDPWVGMGENLMFIWALNYHEATTVQGWWREGYDYTYETEACTNKYGCGHYETVMWAKTHLVGCGIKRCPVLDAFSSRGEAYFIVCNYNGRFLVAQKPYEKGAACSACPEEAPKCRYNLCITEQAYTAKTGYDGNTTLIGIDRPGDNGGSVIRISKILTGAITFIVVTIRGLL